MALLAMLSDPSCLVCGGQMRGESSGETALCRYCEGRLGAAPGLSPPGGLDACFALTGYEGVGRDLVVALKFRGRRAVVPWLGRRMAGIARTQDVEVVTWAPTVRRHRHERGFDQAEVLARSVAKALGVPVRRCLVRLPGPSQTGRHRTERLGAPAFDTAAGAVRAVSGRRVAVVDDVVTTGATLSAAARILRHVGAESVVGLTIARTAE